jgi:hypothetical protein
MIPIMFYLPSSQSHCKTPEASWLSSNVPSTVDPKWGNGKFRQVEVHTCKIVRPDKEVDYVILLLPVWI